MFGVAIVLKKARMTKKGNLDANVVNGGVIETLIVLSEDLVQVVAKACQFTYSCFWNTSLSCSVDFNDYNGLYRGFCFHQMVSPVVQLGMM